MTTTTSTSRLSSSRALPLGPALVRFTGRAEGDLRVPPPGETVSPALAGRRAAVVDRPWSWLRQVHGVDVAMAHQPGAVTGSPADGLVGAAPGVLSVTVADCAPVALASPEGVLGVAHAGWLGLRDGVIEATVAAMRRAGATEVWAALGPCIHAECYEFGADDLGAVAARLGDTVRSTTAAGGTALDVPAAVRAALTRADAVLVHDQDVCTACSAEHWSHRARRDPERQAVVLWQP